MENWSSMNMTIHVIYKETRTVILKNDVFKYLLQTHILKNNWQNMKRAVTQWTTVWSVLLIYTFSCVYDFLSSAKPQTHQNLFWIWHPCVWPLFLWTTQIWDLGQSTLWAAEISECNMWVFESILSLVNTVPPVLINILIITLSSHGN